MPIYTTVMLVLTAALMIPALLLCAGETGWLYSFGRASVKDKRAYAKLLGRAVAALGLCTLASGLLALLSIPAAVIVLAAGFTVTFIVITRKAKEHYN